MATPLEQAVAYIKAGDTERGKQLLAEIIRQNPRDENAWLWMSRCVTQPEQKKYCIDKVLKINPQNQHAIEGLRQLSRPVAPKPHRHNSLVIPLVIAGLVAVAGLIGIAFLFLLFIGNPSASTQQNTPFPTRAVRPERPNYKQMLEANGFDYMMSDNEGNPSYSSPCGAVAVVKPDSVGLLVSHSSDNNCAAEDIGRIVSVMYPSEVFDNVITSMNLLDEFDQMITRTAVGYEISVVLTEYEHTLVVIIRDPH